MNDRFGRLRPDSPRQWGKMSPHQAVCHLSDALSAVMGERQVQPIDNWFSRTVIRWVALHTPLQWPHGVKAPPGIDQVAGEGTPPAEFERDRERLAALHERFIATIRSGQKHAIFGPIQREEWLVWGYRHADHHLRQFGC
ncbi:MAG: DUF1569 domain-containing protein [Bryobacterales bacterium]